MTNPDVTALKRMKATPLQSALWIIAVSVGFLAGQAPAQETSQLKTEQDKRSYAIGADLARNLKRQGVQMEIEPLIQGFRDLLSGGKLLMTDEEIASTLRTYQNELRKARIQAKGGVTPMAEANREKGEAFLDENKTKDGVVALESGLQYRILKAGSGPKPIATDSFECNFRGTTTDGRPFTGTDRAGKPVTLKMSEIIPGWKEALLLMPVGSKWQLFIPAQLAYGDKGIVDGRGRYSVGPNETLVYELELLGIK